MSDLIFIDNQIKQVYKCDYCNEYHIVDLLLYLPSKNKENENRSICPKCMLENKLQTCDKCGYISSKIKKIHDHYYCDKCIKKIHKCVYCGELCDRHYNLTTDNDYICDRCTSKFDSFRVKRYHEPIRLTYYKDNIKVSSENFNGIGVELEIDNGGQKNEVSKKIIEMLDNKVYVMRDGSLNKGLEIVTYPNSFEGLKQLNWDKTFKYLLVNGYKSFKIDTCGLHVHISRTSLTREAIINMLYFNEKFFDILIRIANRDKNKALRYAGLYGLPDYNMLDKARQVVTVYDRCNVHDLRYKAFNIQSRDTVEFRLFTGTLHTKSFFDNIQLILEIVDIAKSITKEEISLWENWYNKFSPDIKAFIDRRIRLYERGNK
ncbi:MAG: amidoligase family protein [Desulfuromonadaceae bacterium]|nr:amidoligase family protein [Desulfuromonadaceae bacterium]